MDNERAFLHSIASPLSAARLLLEILSEEYQAKPEPDIALLAQLTEATSALDKAVELIKARREELIKAGVPSSRGSGK